MLVSNYKVYLTAEGNGAISFEESDTQKIIIIPKNDTIPKEIFDIYYKQLRSFKNRHYAIAKWIVEDIRRMGYDFVSDKIDKLVYKPVKKEISKAFVNPDRLTKEEKLHLLWLELNLLSERIHMNFRESSLEKT